MRTLLRLVATTLVWGIATAAFAQTLWHDLPYGMSVRQVKKLVPEAKDVFDSRIEDGEMERLRIDRFRMVDKDFSVHFFFSARDQKLAAVTVSLGDFVDVSTVREAFEALSKHFRGKYGHEVSSELRELRNKAGITGHAVWMSGYTRIDIVVIPATRTTAMFFARYRIECPSSNRKRGIVELQCPEIVANKTKGQK